MGYIKGRRVDVKVTWASWIGRYVKHEANFSLDFCVVIPNRLYNEFKVPTGYSSFDASYVSTLDSLSSSSGVVTGNHSWQVNAAAFALCSSGIVGRDISVPATLLSWCAKTRHIVSHMGEREGRQGERERERE